MIGPQAGTLSGLGLQDTRRIMRRWARRGLSERLFGELAAQLEERGLLVKAGTLLDATLVEAQVPGLGAKSERDPDADWTRSGRATLATARGSSRDAARKQ